MVINCPGCKSLADPLETRMVLYSSPPPDHRISVRGSLGTGGGQVDFAMAGPNGFSRFVARVPGWYLGGGGYTGCASAPGPVDFFSWCGLDRFRQRPSGPVPQPSGLS